MPVARLILEIEVGQLLPVVVAHHKAGGLFFDRPGRLEAAFGDLLHVVRPGTASLSGASSKRACCSRPLASSSRRRSVFGCAFRQREFDSGQCVKFNVRIGSAADLLGRALMSALPRGIANKVGCRSMRDSREKRLDVVPSAEGGMTRLAFACAQEKQDFRLNPEFCQRGETKTRCSSF